MQIKAVGSVVRLLACGYFFIYRSAFPQSATVDGLLLCIEWEDEDVAQNLRTQKEILLVKCCCRKKRCTKGTNCKCRKNALACGPLCRCESCSSNNKDELEEGEDKEDANESNDSSEDEKDEEMLEDADENSNIYELETENDDENAGILDMLAEPHIQLHEYIYQTNK